MVEYQPDLNSRSCSYVEVHLYTAKFFVVNRCDNFDMPVCTIDSSIGHKLRTLMAELIKFV